MLPRPKRFELIECNPVFLSIAETLGAEFQTPPRLASKQQDDSEVTVHGTGFRHPCRNDELWVSLTYLCITMSAPRGNAVKARSAGWTFPANPGDVQEMPVSHLRLNRLISAYRPASTTDFNAANPCSN